MDLWSITKFQILVYCHLKNISLSDQLLACVTFLALAGEKEITEFCEQASRNEIFGSAQSVRNALSKCEKLGLIVKNGKNRKTIVVSPNINVQINGNILLDYKFVRVESETIKEPA
jgi:thiamine biosynthesis protein ThiC